MEVDGRRMLIEMAVISIVLLIIIQIAAMFPIAKNLNSSDSPIDEEVEFTVSSFLGQTDSRGRVKVTFECQATVSTGNPNVEWYLLDDNHVIEELEGGDASEDCGDIWDLKPGTYRLKTFKTDGIRFDQTVKVHSVDEAANSLRVFSLLIGLVVVLFRSRRD